MNLFARIAEFLKGDEIFADGEEAASQNRLAIRYFAATGIPVGIANIVAQTLLGGTQELEAQSYWIVVYYAILLLLDRYVIPSKCRQATLLLYLCEAPVLLMSILLGTVWDPSTQAITFLMIMVTVPVFILDRPLRLMSIMLGWNIVFLGMCAAVKDPSILQTGLLHALEFYLSSVAIIYVVLRLRLQVQRSLERTRYHLEHDVVEQFHIVFVQVDDPAVLDAGGC